MIMTATAVLEPSINAAMFGAAALDFMAWLRRCVAV